MQRVARWTMALAAPVAAALAAAAPAPAQAPVELDTVRVAAASRASSALATATRAVEVIDAEEIRRTPAGTVTEVLRWAMGVELMPRSPALADVGIRGSSFEQVLVMVDGVRVSDAQTGHFDLDLAVPLDQVERVEVLRGPASTLHGADAVGGVINIVTRRDGGGTSARAEAGSFDTRALALAHGATIRGARVDAGGEARRSSGHRDGTDYEMGSARLAVTLPLAGGSLAADAAHAARDFGAAGFYGPSPSYERTRTTTAALAWRADAGARRALEPVLSLRRHSDDFVLRREDPGFYRNRHETLEWGGVLTGRAELGPALRAAVGAEAFQDRLRSEALGDREESRAAAFGELAAGRVGRWTAAAGLRADWREGLGAFWSPSLSAAWWPLRPVRLRASAGRAFRAPTWTERYYHDPANIGDPSLGPERSWSAEAGAEAFLPAGVHLALSAWRRDAEGLIDWARPTAASTDPWHTRNVARADFRGLELEAGAPDPLGTRWTARAALLSLESSAAPGFTSKYALRPMSEQLSLAAEREVGGGVGIWAQARRERRRGEEPFLLLDARATLDLRPVRLHLDLQNALDERYPDITGLAAPGRMVVVGAEWRGGED